jgi:hypothetical protein
MSIRINSAGQIKRIITLFSEPVAWRQGNTEEESYALWKKLFYYLIAYGIIENPIAILTISWDLERGRWYPETPFLVNKKHYDKFVDYILNYYFITQKLGNYKLTDSIYRDFPVKTILSYSFCDDESPKQTTVKVQLRRNGRLDFIKIRNIPTNLIKIDGYDSSDYSNERKRGLEDGLEEKLVSCGDSGYYIINSSDITRAVENDKALLDGINISFNESKFEVFKNRLTTLFEKLAIIEYEAQWSDVIRNAENIAKSICIAGYLAKAKFNSFAHVPSYELDEFSSDANNEQQKIKEVSTGGVLVHCNNKTRCHFDLLRIILNMVNRSKSIVEHRNLVISTTKRYAIRSAVAAIMARNMSHNIGSHILARVDIDDYKRKLCSIKPDLREKIYQEIFREFHKYLQEKSDFLAEISTEPERPFIPAWLFRDIILPFDRQVIIKEFIGRNEGIKDFSQIRIRLFVDNCEIKINSWQCEEGPAQSHTPCKKGLYKICLDSDCSQIVFPEKIENIGKDVLIEVPGTLGKFAIYNILEGFIRNCCKHNTKEIGNRLENERCPVLTVNIAVHEDEDGEHYVCELWDDISEVKDNLVEKMKEKFGAKVIDETGKLNRENWGSAELKICAALLKDVDFLEMNENYENCIEVIKKENKLGYKFYLKKYMRGICIGKRWEDWLKGENMQEKKMEMSTDWISIEKEKLLSLLEELDLKIDHEKVVISIDREKKPDEDTFKNLRWERYNNFWEINSETVSKEPDLSPKDFMEDNVKVGLVISDILGKYQFKPGTHKIILYEKNIQKTAKKLESIVLLILRHLAVSPFPSFINRRHFPLETFIIRKLLNLSSNYQSFIKKLSDYFIYEYFFWNSLEEFEKGKKKLENEIELLPICSREMFDGLYEVVFWHEVGHLIDHLLSSKNSKTCNRESKEAFADLFSLYFAPGINEKVIFFSLAQVSDSSWFKYYKILNKAGEIFKSSSDLDYLNILNKYI